MQLLRVTWSGRGWPVLANCCLEMQLTEPGALSEDTGHHRPEDRVPPARPLSLTAISNHIGLILINRSFLAFFFGVLSVSLKIRKTRKVNASTVSSAACHCFANLPKYLFAAILTVAHSVFLPIRYYWHLK